MPRKPPTDAKLRTLWKKVETFIDQRDITCPESIWQMDRATEDIEPFIESLCKVVGYAKNKD